MLSKFYFVVLQCLSASAQLPFSQPIAGEVVNGGVPFVVSVFESLGVPFLGQMQNFSLLLLTGTYYSPFTIYAWNLATINPASISASVSFPRALASNGENAYFLGIKGYLRSNTSISTTYFSPLFTLQNMTGPPLSAIPSSTSLQASTPKSSSLTVVSVATPIPGRSISCISSSGEETIGELGGSGGLIKQSCESAVLKVFSILSKQTRTLSAAASIITSPPAFSQFAALLVQAVPSPSSTTPMFSTGTSTSRDATVTPSSGVDGLGEAPSTSTTSNSSRVTVEMTYMLITIGISFATIIVLFWIFLRYRHNRQLLPTLKILPNSTSEDPPSRCIHAGYQCECSRLRKMYDGVVTEFNLLRLGSIRSRTATSDADPAEAEKGLASQAARPWTAGSRAEITSPVCSAAETPPLILNNEARRRRFEEEYRRRRASRASSRSRRSQRTILAELEGDLAPFAEECKDVVPPMPTVNALLTSLRLDIYPDENDERYESVIRARNKTFVVRRKTMVGEGKTGVFIKGKVAATIVAVRRKPIPGTKIRIEESSEINFPALTHEQLKTYYDEKNQHNETDKRNGGEIDREHEAQTPMHRTSTKDWRDFEDAITEAMKQTRLDDLRRERRRKKRSHLAKGSGSRDLGGVFVPLPSK